MQIILRKDKRVNRFQFNSDAVAAAKGLVILLMVMVHGGSPQWANGYIVMWHMPLFFIMSGYCFKEKYLSDARAFAMKRVKGVWWPYVKWTLFFVILHNVLFHLNVYNDVFGFNGQVSHLYTWREFGVAIVKTFYFGTGEQLLGGYWFLKELFWASLIGYAVIWLGVHSKRRLLTSFSLQGGVILTLLLIFAYFGKDFHVPAIGISQRTWMATFFFLFGHAWRSWEEGGTWFSRYDAAPWWLQGFIVAALAVSVKVVMIFFGHTSMLSFTLVNAVPYVVAALSGSVMVVYVCRWLVSRAWALRSFLVFTGRHTFEVLTWHFSCFKLVSLLLIAIYGLDIEYLAWFPVISTAALQGAGVEVSWTLWWIVYLVVGAGIPILWQYVKTKLKRKT